MPLHYLYLLVAVTFEVIGTAALQASQQFTRFWPSLVVAVGYGMAFWFLSLTLRHMQVGVVYAIWSGLGILMIAVIGYVAFGQKPDLAAILGMALILVGILVINLFSDSAHR